MSDEPDYDFRAELQKFLDDPTTDFTDAVLVLPAEAQVTHDSPNPLTAVGVLEWCKASLLASADDEMETPEPGEGPKRKRVLN